MVATHKHPTAKVCNLPRLWRAVTDGTQARSYSCYTAMAKTRCCRCWGQPSGDESMITSPVLPFYLSSRGRLGARASLTWGTHGTRMHYEKNARCWKGWTLWAIFCWQNRHPRLKLFWYLIPLRVLSQTTHVSRVASIVFPKKIKKKDI